MAIILDCYEDIRFYDFLVFDTVFLHSVNFMRVLLYNEMFFYYQYDNSVLLTTNEMKNDRHIPGILSLKHYVNHINKRLKSEQFTINIDNYHQPVGLSLVDISRRYKINKIKNR